MQGIYSPLWLTPWFLFSGFSGRADVPLEPAAKGFNCRAFEEPQRLVQGGYTFTVTPTYFSTTREVGADEELTVDYGVGLVFIFGSNCDSRLRSTP